MISDDSPRLFDHAYADSPIHRLSAGAKSGVSLFFILAVVSYDRYEIAALLPFFFFPILLITLGDIPLRLLLLRLLIVSPFAILAGAANPFFDREPLQFLGREIAGGWLSFISILIRFLLTVSTALALAAVTPFEKICRALSRAGAPQALVTQLLILYRYLNLAGEEAGRIMLARDLRDPYSRSRSFRNVSPLIGSLFTRALDRGEAVHQAMLLRGFDGRQVMLEETTNPALDLGFAVGLIAIISALRFSPAVEIVGRFLLGSN